jgi:hypothetical protein
VDAENNIIEEAPLPMRYRKDAGREDLILGRVLTMTATLCFRNVIKEFPPEKYKVTNGDTFLISMLGHYGKGKWMWDVIKKSMYRSHGGGVWSMVSNEDKLPVRINTYYWLYSYYNRIGEKRYALKWYGKILYAVIMFEPGRGSSGNGHFTDGVKSRGAGWKILSRKIWFKVAMWMNGK